MLVPSVTSGADLEHVELHIVCCRNCSLAYAADRK